MAADGVPLTATRRRYGTKCGGCGQGLSPTDLVRKARDKVYHLRCFTCALCRRQLSTGEELYLLDDARFLCKDDFLRGKTPPGEYRTVVALQLVRRRAFIMRRPVRPITGSLFLLSFLPRAPDQPTAFGRHRSLDTTNQQSVRPNYDRPPPSSIDHLWKDSTQSDRVTWLPHVLFFFGAHTSATRNVIETSRRRKLQADFRSVGVVVFLLIFGVCVCVPTVVGLGFIASNERARVGHVSGAPGNKSSKLKQKKKEESRLISVISRRSTGCNIESLGRGVSADIHNDTLFFCFVFFFSKFSLVNTSSRPDSRRVNRRSMESVEKLSGWNWNTVEFG